MADISAQIDPSSAQSAATPRSMPRKRIADRLNRLGWLMVVCAGILAWFGLAIAMEGPGQVGQTMLHWAGWTGVGGGVAILADAVLGLLNTAVDLGVRSNRS